MSGEQEQKVCAYPDCTNKVTGQDLCYGCDSYVCEEHSRCDPPWGHSVEDHWDVCDVCGEHPSSCSCDEDCP